MGLFLTSRTEAAAVGVVEFGDGLKGSDEAGQNNALDNAFTALNSNWLIRKIAKSGSIFVVRTRKIGVPYPNAISKEEVFFAERAASG